MSIKLRIGKLQEELVKQFTAIEVRTLTIWFYLSAGGLAAIVFGLNDLFIVHDLPLGAASLVAGIIVSLGSAKILSNGLHSEHDLATETGNVGPDV